MAWTTPQTVVADSTELTAALWNEQVRDNTNFLYTPPMVAVRLTSDVNPYTSLTDISWQAEDYDTDNMWSSGATITINTSGVYVMSLTAGPSATATLNRVGAIIFVNGGRKFYQDYVALTSTRGYCSVYGVYKMSAGDTITTQLEFFGGSNYRLEGQPLASDDNTVTKFSVAWLGSG